VRVERLMRVLDVTAERIVVVLEKLERLEVARVEVKLGAVPELRYE
jgi:hypothetical protein